MEVMTRRITNTLVRALKGNSLEKSSKSFGSISEPSNASSPDSSTRIQPHNLPISPEANPAPIPGFFSEWHPVPTGDPPRPPLTVLPTFDYPSVMAFHVKHFYIDRLFESF
jgi:hypothetical protein